MIHQNTYPSSNCRQKPKTCSLSSFFFLWEQQWLVLSVFYILHGTNTQKDNFETYSTYFLSVEDPGNIKPLLPAAALYTLLSDRLLIFTLSYHFLLLSLLLTFFWDFLLNKTTITRVSVILYSRGTQSKTPLFHIISKLVVLTKLKSCPALENKMYS